MSCGASSRRRRAWLSRAGLTTAAASRRPLPAQPPPAPSTARWRPAAPPRRSNHSPRAPASRAPSRTLYAQLPGQCARARLQRARLCAASAEPSLAITAIVRSELGQQIAGLFGDRLRGGAGLARRRRTLRAVSRALSARCRTSLRISVSVQHVDPVWWQEEKAGEARRRPQWLTRPSTRVTAATTNNTKNRILAISTAPAAMPPKPNRPRPWGDDEEDDGVVQHGWTPCS